MEKELVGECLQRKGHACVCSTGDKASGSGDENPFKRDLEKGLENLRVTLDKMPCEFRPGRGTIDAIFIVRQMQEKFLVKKKELWMALWIWRRLLDRVPRDCVVGFAGCVGVDE